MEIYFDESGNHPEMTVGGLAIIYPDRSAPKKFSERLSNVYYWGPHRDDPTVRNATAFKASDTQGSLQTKFNTVAGIAVNLGLKVASFHLVGKVPANPLAASLGPDHAYRRLLRDNLEILLYLWLPQVVPAVAPAANATVSIYVGTRVLGEGSASGAVLLQLAHRYGLGMRLTSDPPKQPWSLMEIDAASPVFANVDFQNVAAHWFAQPFSRKSSGPDTYVVVDENALDANQRQALIDGNAAPAHDFIVYSFSEDHVHPMLSELGQLRPNTPLPFLVEAKGAQLTYARAGSASPNRLPRAAHFVADWVVSRPDVVPAAWKSLGFQRRQDDSLAELLRASRLLDQGANVEALLHWLKAKPDGRDSVQKWLAPRFAAIARGLARDQFIRFCESS